MRRSGERPVDSLGLVVGGLVVSVDLGGLRVGVAHPVLDRPQRHAGGSGAGAEGVEQLVKGDLGDARAADGRFEVADQLGVGAAVCFGSIAALQKTRDAPARQR